MRRLANGVRSVDLSQYFLWVVAAVIIGAVVYLSSLERVRDFAVLKAVGATSASLYAGLAVQSTIIALVSAGFAMLLQPVISPFVPIPLDVPVYQYLLLPAVAVVVGLLASLTGLRQAVRVDPALAFG
jgi:putative ABC transport system permease protein